MLCISVSFQVLTCLLIIATLCPSITALLNIVKISEQFINTRRHVNSQYLFGFFNKNKDEKAKLENIKSSVTNAAPKATGKVEASKLSQMKGQLEKISNTQNRDYEAEAIKNAPRPKEIQDKQVQSFNFNKANEFPNLYKGWIKSDGDQIAKQMIASTKQALKTAKLIEVLFDPVPNLDEVAFGTGIYWCLYVFL